MSQTNPLEIMNQRVVDQLFTRATQFNFLTNDEDEDNSVKNDAPTSVTLGPHAQANRIDQIHALRSQSIASSTSTVTLSGTETSSENQLIVDASKESPLKPNSPVFKRVINRLYAQGVLSDAMTEQQKLNAIANYVDSNSAFASLSTKEKLNVKAGLMTMAFVRAGVSPDQARNRVRLIDYDFQTTQASGTVLVITKDDGSFLFDDGVAGNDDGRFDPVMFDDQRYYGPGTDADVRSLERVHYVGFGIVFDRLTVHKPNMSVVTYDLRQHPELIIDIYDPDVQQLLQDMKAANIFGAGDNPETIAMKIHNYLQDRFSVLLDYGEEWISNAEFIARGGGDTEDFANLTATLMAAAIADSDFNMSGYSVEVFLGRTVAGKVGAAVELRSGTGSVHYFNPVSGNISDVTAIPNAHGFAMVYESYNDTRTMKYNSAPNDFTVNDLMPMSDHDAVGSVGERWIREYEEFMENMAKPIGSNDPSSPDYVPDANPYFERNEFGYWEVNQAYLDAMERIQILQMLFMHAMTVIHARINIIETITNSMYDTGQNPSKANRRDRSKMMGTFNKMGGKMMEALNYSFQTSFQTIMEANAARYLERMDQLKDEYNDIDDAAKDQAAANEQRLTLMRKMREESSNYKTSIRRNLTRIGGTRTSMPNMGEADPNFESNYDPEGDLERAIDAHVGDESFWLSNRGEYQSRHGDFIVMNTEFFAEMERKMVQAQTIRRAYFTYHLNRNQLVEKIADSFAGREINKNNQILDFMQSGIEGLYGLQYTKFSQMKGFAQLYTSIHNEWVKQDINVHKLEDAVARAASGTAFWANIGAVAAIVIGAALAPFTGGASLIVGAIVAASLMVVASAANMAAAIRNYELEMDTAQLRSTTTFDGSNWEQDEAEAGATLEQRRNRRAQRVYGKNYNELSAEEKAVIDGEITEQDLITDMRNLRGSMLDIGGDRAVIDWTKLAEYQEKLLKAQESMRAAFLVMKMRADLVATIAASLGEKSKYNLVNNIDSILDSHFTMLNNFSSLAEYELNEMEAIKLWNADVRENRERARIAMWVSVGTFVLTALVTIAAVFLGPLALLAVPMIQGINDWLIEEINYAENDYHKRLSHSNNVDNAARRRRDAANPYDPVTQPEEYEAWELNRTAYSDSAIRNTGGTTEVVAVGTDNYDGKYLDEMFFVRKNQRLEQLATKALARVMTTQMKAALFARFAAELGATSTSASMAGDLSADMVERRFEFFMKELALIKQNLSNKVKVQNFLYQAEKGLEQARFTGIVSTFVPILGRMLAPMIYSGYRAHNSSFNRNVVDRPSWDNTVINNERDSDKADMYRDAMSDDSIISSESSRIGSWELGSGFYGVKWSKWAKSMTVLKFIWAKRRYNMKVAEGEAALMQSMVESLGGGTTDISASRNAHKVFNFEKSTAQRNITGIYSQHANWAEREMEIQKDKFDFFMAAVSTTIQAIALLASLAASFSGSTGSAKGTDAAQTQNQSTNPKANEEGQSSKENKGATAFTDYMSGWRDLRTVFLLMAQLFFESSADFVKALVAADAAQRSKEEVAEKEMNDRRNAINRGNGQSGGYDTRREMAGLTTAEAQLYEYSMNKGSYNTVGAALDYEQTMNQRVWESIYNTIQRTGKTVGKKMKEAYKSSEGAAQLVKRSRTLLSIGASGASLKEYMVQLSKLLNEVNTSFKEGTSVTAGKPINLIKNLQDRIPDEAKRKAFGELMKNVQAKGRELSKVSDSLKQLLETKGNVKQVESFLTSLDRSFAIQEEMSGDLMKMAELTDGIDVRRVSSSGLRSMSSRITQAVLYDGRASMATIATNFRTQLINQQLGFAMMERDGEEFNNAIDRIGGLDKVEGAFAQKIHAQAMTQSVKNLMATTFENSRVLLPDADRFTLGRALTPAGSAQKRKSWEVGELFRRMAQDRGSAEKNEAGRSLAVSMLSKFSDRPSETMTFALNMHYRSGDDGYELGRIDHRGLLRTLQGIYAKTKGTNNNLLVKKMLAAGAKTKKVGVEGTESNMFHDAIALMKSDRLSSKGGRSVAREANDLFDAAMKETPHRLSERGKSRTHGVFRAFGTLATGNLNKYVHDSRGYLKAVTHNSKHHRDAFNKAQATAVKLQMSTEYRGLLMDAIHKANEDEGEILKRHGDGVGAKELSDPGTKTDSAELDDGGVSKVDKGALVDDPGDTKDIPSIDETTGVKSASASDDSHSDKVESASRVKDENEQGDDEDEVTKAKKIAGSGKAMFDPPIRRKDDRMGGTDSSSALLDVYDDIVKSADANETVKEAATDIVSSAKAGTLTVGSARERLKKAETDLGDQRAEIADDDADRVDKLATLDLASAQVAQLEAQLDRHVENESDFLQYATHLSQREDVSDAVREAANGILGSDKDPEDIRVEIVKGRVQLESDAAGMDAAKVDLATHQLDLLAAKAPTVNRESWIKLEHRELMRVTQEKVGDDPQKAVAVLSGGSEVDKALADAIEKQDEDSIDNAVTVFEKELNDALKLKKPADRLAELVKLQSSAELCLVVCDKSLAELRTPIKAMSTGIQAHIKVTMSKMSTDEIRSATKAIIKAQLKNIVAKDKEGAVDALFDGDVFDIQDSDDDQIVKEARSALVEIRDGFKKIDPKGASELRGLGTALIALDSYADSLNKATPDLSQGMGILTLAEIGAGQLDGVMDMVDAAQLKDQLANYGVRKHLRKQPERYFESDAFEGLKALARGDKIGITETELEGIAASHRSTSSGLGAQIAGVQATKAGFEYDALKISGLRTESQMTAFLADRPRFTSESRDRLAPEVGGDRVTYDDLPVSDQREVDRRLAQNDASTGDNQAIKQALLQLRNNLAKEVASGEEGIDYFDLSPTQQNTVEERINAIRSESLRKLMLKNPDSSEEFRRVWVSMGQVSLEPRHGREELLRMIAGGSRRLEALNQSVDPSKVRKKRKALDSQIQTLSGQALLGMPVSDRLAKLKQQRRDLDDSIAPIDRQKAQLEYYYAELDKLDTGGQPSLGTVRQAQFLTHIAASPDSMDRFTLLAAKDDQMRLIMTGMLQDYVSKLPDPKTAVTLNATDIKRVFTPYLRFTGGGDVTAMQELDNAANKLLVKLKDAGVLTTKQDGGRTVYQINAETVHNLYDKVYEIITDKQDPEIRDHIVRATVDSDKLTKDGIKYVDSEKFKRDMYWYSRDIVSQMRRKTAGVAGAMDDAVGEYIKADATQAAQFANRRLNDGDLTHSLAGILNIDTASALQVSRMVVQTVRQELAAGSVSSPNDLLTSPAVGKTLKTALTSIGVGGDDLEEMMRKAKQAVAHTYITQVFGIQGVGAAFIESVARLGLDTDHSSRANLMRTFLGDIKAMDLPGHVSKKDKEFRRLQNLAAVLPYLITSHRTEGYFTAILNMREEAAWMISDRTDRLMVEQELIKHIDQNEMYMVPDPPSSPKKAKKPKTKQADDAEKTSPSAGAKPGDKPGTRVEPPTGARATSGVGRMAGVRAGDGTGDIDDSLDDGLDSEIGVDDGDDIETTGLEVGDDISSPTDTPIDEDDRDKAKKADPGAPKSKVDPASKPVEDDDEDDDDSPIENRNSDIRLQQLKSRETGHLRFVALHIMAQKIIGSGDRERKKRKTKQLEALMASPRAFMKVLMAFDDKDSARLGDMPKQIATLAAFHGKRDARVRLIKEMLRDPMIAKQTQTREAVAILMMDLDMSTSENRIGRVPVNRAKVDKAILKEVMDVDVLSPLDGKEGAAALEEQSLAAWDMMMGLSKNVAELLRPRDFLTYVNDLRDQVFTDRNGRHKHFGLNETQSFGTVLSNMGLADREVRKAIEEDLVSGIAGSRAKEKLTSQQRHQFQRAYAHLKRIEDDTRQYGKTQGEMDEATRQIATDTQAVLTQNGIVNREELQAALVKGVLSGDIIKKSDSVIEDLRTANLLERGTPPKGEVPSDPKARAERFAKKKDPSLEELLAYRRSSDGTVDFTGYPKLRDEFRAKVTQRVWSRLADDTVTEHGAVISGSDRQVKAGFGRLTDGFAHDRPGFQLNLGEGYDPVGDDTVRYLRSKDLSPIDRRLGTTQRKQLRAEIYGIKRDVYGAADQGGPAILLSKDWGDFGEAGVDVDVSGDLQKAIDAQESVSPKGKSAKKVAPAAGSDPKPTDPSSASVGGASSSSSEPPTLGSKSLEASAAASTDDESEIEPSTPSKPGLNKSASAGAKKPASTEKSDPLRITADTFRDRQTIVDFLGKAHKNVTGIPPYEQSRFYNEFINVLQRTNIAMGDWYRHEQARITPIGSLNTAPSIF